MADPKLKDSLKDAKAAEDAINRLKDVGTEFSAVYQDIGKALSGLAKGSKEYSSNIKDAESLSKDLATRSWKSTNPVPPGMICPIIKFDLKSSR